MTERTIMGLDLPDMAHADFHKMRKAMVKALSIAAGLLQHFEDGNEIESVHDETMKLVEVLATAIWEASQP